MINSRKGLGMIFIFHLWHINNTSTVILWDRYVNLYNSAGQLVACIT